MSDERCVGLTRKGLRCTAPGISYWGGLCWSHLKVMQRTCMHARPNGTSKPHGVVAGVQFFRCSRCMAFVDCDGNAVAAEWGFDGVQHTWVVPAQRLKREPKEQPVATPIDSDIAIFREECSKRNRDSAAIISRSESNRVEPPKFSEYGLTYDDLRCARRQPRRFQAVWETE